VAAVVLGLAVLGPYLSSRLPPLTGRPEYRVTAAAIELVPPPPHPVPQDLVEQVRIQNRLPRELSLLDPDLSQKLASAFGRHAWVEHVDSVTQSFPARVVVRLQYRVPTATVQVQSGRVPIDRKGVLLPSEDFSPTDAGRLPVIRLQTGQLMTQAGSRISEPRVADAAELAEVLSEKWQTLGLDFIEIPHGSALETDARFYLQTKSGTRILWGRAPGTMHPGELSAAQKLARLERYVLEFGGFDRPNGPYEIDIRHWQEITRRPLKPVQAAAPRRARR